MILFLAHGVGIKVPIFNFPMYKLDQLNIFECKNSLGEGLFVKNGDAAWVDINKKNIYVSDKNDTLKYNTKYTPSIIFEFDNSRIIYGSEIGVISFCRETHYEKCIKHIPFKLNNYRSNDGGWCGNHQLMSFMHCEIPHKKTGFIYIIGDDEWKLVDDSIHIPNTFIEIMPSKILISDSLTGEIWLYHIDGDGHLIKKTLWTSMDDGNSPDGGCMVGEHVFISIWDGQSIGIYNLNGLLLNTLSVPVIRPTNCKFDKKECKLWLTSASEGLSKADILKYPNSGNTFTYNLEYISSC